MQSLSVWCRCRRRYLHYYYLCSNFKYISVKKTTNHPLDKSNSIIQINIFNLNLVKKMNLSNLIQINKINNRFKIPYYNKQKIVVFFIFSMSNGIFHSSPDINRPFR